MTEFGKAIAEAYAVDGAAIDLAPRAKRRRRVAAPAPAGDLERLGDFLGSREGKVLQRRVARGLFGMLKKRL